MATKASEGIEWIGTDKIKKEQLNNEYEGGKERGERKRWWVFEAERTGLNRIKKEAKGEDRR